MPLVHASLITYLHSKVDNTSKIKETITKQRTSKNRYYYRQCLSKMNNNSVQLTVLSMPSVMRSKKKMIDQNTEPVSVEMASGYT